MVQPPWLSSGDGRKYRGGEKNVSTWGRGRNSSPLLRAWRPGKGDSEGGPLPEADRRNRPAGRREDSGKETDPFGIPEQGRQTEMDRPFRRRKTERARSQKGQETARGSSQFCFRPLRDPL